MKKVKVFISSSTDDLQNQINIFFDQNPNIDPQEFLYQITATQFSLLLYYIDNLPS